MTEDEVDFVRPLMEKVGELERGVKLAAHEIGRLRRDNVELRGHVDDLSTEIPKLKKALRALLDLIESEQVRSAFVVAAIHGCGATQEQADKGAAIIRAAKEALGAGGD